MAKRRPPRSRRRSEAARERDRTASRARPAGCSSRRTTCGIALLPVHSTLADSFRSTRRPAYGGQTRLRPGDPERNASSGHLLARGLPRTRSVPKYSYVQQVRWFQAAVGAGYLAGSTSRQKGYLLRRGSSPSFPVSCLSAGDSTHRAGVRCSGIGSHQPHRPTSTEIRP